MTRYIVFTFWMLLATLSTTGKNQPTGMEFYDRFESLSTNKLKQMAINFSAQHETVDSAIVCYTIIINRYGTPGHTDTNDLEEKVRSQALLGYLYCIDRYDFLNAYNNLRKAEELAQVYDLSALQPVIYLNLSVVFYMYHSFNNDATSATYARNYLAKAFYSGIHTNKPWVVVPAFMDFIYDTFFEGDQENGRKVLEAFMAYKLPVDDPSYSLAMALGKACEAYIDKQFEQSLHLLDSAYNHVYGDVNTRNRFRTMIGINKVRVLKNIGDIDMARHLLSQVETFALVTDLRDVLINIYKEYIDLYKRIGNDHAVMYYSLKYHEQKDSLMFLGGVSNVRGLEFQYELNEANTNITSLLQQKHEQQMWLIFVSVVSLLSLILMVVKIKNYHRKKETARLLFSKSVELLEKEKNEILSRYSIEKSSMPASKTTKEKDGFYSTISDDEKERIYSKILEVFETSQEIYNSDFSSATLVQLTGIRYRVLSSIINERFGSNFNTILTRYRISEACRRLLDHNNYDKYTIEALAESVGFKSRTTFATNFKRLTGLSPSEYQRLSR